MNKLILTLSLLVGCVDTATFGEVGSTYQCEKTITCDNDVRTDVNEYCSYSWFGKMLQSREITACEEEVAVRGCKTYYCSAHCGGTGGAFANVCWLEE